MVLRTMKQLDQMFKWMIVTVTRIRIIIMASSSICSAITIASSWHGDL